MNHINAMFKRNVDDVILSKVSSHGSEPLANLVRLIGLYAYQKGAAGNTSINGKSVVKWHLCRASANLPIVSLGKQTFQ